MRVHFVLMGEGSSDDGLVPHLENLCVQLGADEVTGTRLDFERLDQPIGRTVEAKLRAAMLLEPSANLFLVHRDADSRDAELRYSEVDDAVRAAKVDTPTIGIVPVQETEAWLLLSEHAIRAVARHPNGRRPLNLPRAQHVEAVARPKERLQAALIEAAEVSGRRLERFRREFPTHRRLLLHRLPSGGPLEHVGSWIRMREELRHFITAVAGEE